MIEDALKSTRTLHRLIMTVSLVTIVFALSISLPQDKASQKQIIDDLIAIDFAAYNEFVEGKVAETSQAILDPLSKKFAAQLESKGHLTFGLDTLAAEFGKPIHIGRMLHDQLILNEVSNASIVQMNALNGLSLNANVQILVPKTEQLLKEIDEFLASYPRAGQRVDTIRISIGDFDFTGESFLPGSETTVGIYFELLDAVRIGGTPTFSANFLADIVEIDDSSFLHWLRSQSFDEQLVMLDRDEIVFARDLTEAPKGFANEKLGVLSLRLQEDISKSSPASQSISILGTNVPGALAIFASPIILFALAYYFGAHTGHLSRIVSKHRDSFEEFSWLPISLKSELDISVSKRMTLKLPAGVFECLSSAIVLPIAALGLLFFRLQTFGSLPNLQMICLIGAAIGIAGFGVLSLRNVTAVRRSLAELKPVELEENVGQ